MPGIQVTLKKTTTYPATMLVTAATGPTECFPSVATNVISSRWKKLLIRSYPFPVLWTLIRNRVTHHPADEQRDRIRKGAASRAQCARPQRRAFLAAWVRLNAIGLIALSRLWPLRVFSGSDRRTLRQNSFLALELMRVLVKLKGYE